MKRKMAVFAVAGAAAVLLLAPAGSVYYQHSGGAACARCHEIQPNHESWLSSSHRDVPCSACHGSVMTTDVAFHMNNLRRLVQHVGGDVPPQIRMRTEDVAPMVERCASCHRQEYAQWLAGPHGRATYARIFTDQAHNSRQVMMDDCLRCHGAHFQGGIEDLVAPVDTKGPWRLLRPELADVPTMPCMMCHQVHRPGEPMVKRALQAPARGEEISRPSLALFDRRELNYLPVYTLPLPAMLDGARPVKTSPDQRQALCYQCHAPLATRQAGSGDDRTPLGVHEGLSCLACHQKHGQQTRASCANCHPRLSNCGLDVEAMDTTFRDPASKHNIHTVKCVDCHPRGVPRPTTRQRTD
jgi:hypothetical protein